MLFRSGLMLHRHLASQSAKSRDPNTKMGVIEVKLMSEEIPNATYFVVNFPHYPSSISRAIETLVGTEEIAKMRPPLSLFTCLKTR